MSWPEFLILIFRFASTGDLWALGCILYEMVAGTPPFVSDDANELNDMILGTGINVAALTAAPNALVTLILGLLEKSPAGRFGWQQVADSEFFGSALEEHATADVELHLERVLAGNVGAAVEAAVTRSTRGSVATSVTTSVASQPSIASPHSQHSRHSQQGAQSIAQSVSRSVSQSQQLGSQHSQWSGSMTAGAIPVMPDVDLASSTSLLTSAAAYRHHHNHHHNHNHNHNRQSAPALSAALTPSNVGLLAAEGTAASNAATAYDETPVRGVRGADVRQLSTFFRPFFLDHP